MTVKTVKDMKMTIGELLRKAGAGPLFLQEQGEMPYAVIPLDEELIDFLLERNPQFIEECRKIRQNMQSGKVLTQQQVNRLFRR